MPNPRDQQYWQPDQPNEWLREAKDSLDNAYSADQPEPTLKAMWTNPTDAFAASASPYNALFVLDGIFLNTSSDYGGGPDYTQYIEPLTRSSGNWTVYHGNGPVPVATYSDNVTFVGLNGARFTVSVDMSTISLEETSWSAPAIIQKGVQRTLDIQIALAIYVSNQVLTNRNQISLPFVRITNISQLELNGRLASTSGVFPVSGGLGTTGSQPSFGGHFMALSI